jgi:hypothetical protein
MTIGPNKAHKGSTAMLVREFWGRFFNRIMMYDNMLCRVGFIQGRS